jgi:hypothetical protein
MNQDSRGPGWPDVALRIVDILVTGEKTAATRVYIVLALAALISVAFCSVLAAVRG